MIYRLGLDMGTDSIGWAIISLDENNKPLDVINMGSRIFRGGRDPKSYESLAQTRRTARSMRRMRDRRIRRKKALLLTLIEQGLMPSNKEERLNLRNLNPYKLRFDAVNRKLDNYELGRALFHLGSRRGFKSNRLTDKKDNDTRTQAKMISKLTENIEKSGFKTLGAYLYSRLNEGKETRFRKNTFDCYPSREHYENEFQEIKKFQSVYHNVDWEKIYNVIFNQRKLKPQEKGKCRYYPKEYRAYASLPSSHIFRILSEVNNLIYSDIFGKSVFLNNEEKDKLIKKLNEQKSLTFKKIKKILGLDDNVKFNLEDERKKDLKGNETSIDMRQIDCFGESWDKLNIYEQDKIVESLIGAETDEECFDILRKYDLPEEKMKNICSYSFSNKVTNLSSRFMRECSEIMKNDHLNYPEATEKMGFHHSNYKPDDEDFLPYYGKILIDSVTHSHPEAENVNEVYKYGKISNPTVHIALGQLRALVNSIIKNYGKPEQVVIELSRDIAKSAKERKEIDSNYTRNQKENERIKTEIEKLGIKSISRMDIKKYKLWEELSDNPLDRRCPYCGEQINGSVLYSKEIEIEHILPRSRTNYAEPSIKFLTVSHSTCNRDKGNRSPYEAFSSSSNSKYKWNEIMERAHNFKDKEKYKLFLENAMDSYENDGFVNRQLNDGRFISKMTRTYMSCVCKDVWCINGQNTGFLRKNWGLNSFLNKESGDNKKNRNDHRHHAIDALVIALTDRSMVKAMADLNVKTDNYEDYKVPKFPLKKESVKDVLKNIIVSHRQDHGHTGCMFKETATGRKIVPQKIFLRDLKEDNLVLTEDIKVKLDSFINKGLSFKKAKENLIKELGNINVLIGQEVWVTTKNIMDLDEKDIINNRIFDPYLREYIRNETSGVISDKTEFKNRLENISKKFNVKKIRYIPKSQSYEQILSANNKWYERDDVNFVIVWEIPVHKNQKNKRYEGQFVSYQMVKNYDNLTGKFHLTEECISKKPHPAAKKIATIYKNDVLLIKPVNQNEYLALVAGYAATDNRIDIRPLTASSSISEWVNTISNDITLDISIWKDSPNGSQNFKSINTLFSENVVRPVKITPDGRIVNVKKNS